MGCIRCGKPDECKRSECCGRCPESGNCPFREPCKVCIPNNKEDTAKKRDK